MNNLINNLLFRVCAIGGSLDTRAISVIFLVAIVSLQIGLLIASVIGIITSIKRKNKKTKKQKKIE